MSPRESLPCTATSRSNTVRQSGDTLRFGDDDPDVDAVGEAIVCFPAEKEARRSLDRGVPALSNKGETNPPVRTRS